MNISQFAGMNIRRLRKQRGMSQEDVAAKADIGTASLSAVERGSKKYALETLGKIAGALHVDPAFLLKPEESMQHSEIRLDRYQPEFERLTARQQLWIADRLKEDLSIQIKLLEAGLAEEIVL